MSDPLTPADLDELERLLAAATDGRWSVNALRIVRGNALVCTLPLNYRGPAPADAAAIVALHNAAPALIAAARDLAWHEDRHGTRAEQEAEDAELAADLARIDALSDEECKAELAAEGIDYDAARKKFDTVVKLCAERADLRARLETAERERDNHARTLYAEGYSPCATAECNCGGWHGGHVAELRARLRLTAQTLIAEIGAGGPMNAEAAAERAVALILGLREERDEARAEADRLRAFVPVWARVVGAWELRACRVRVGWVEWVGHDYVARIDVGRGGWKSVGTHPDLPTAARAVCARLGIPSVDVHDP